MTIRLLYFAHLRKAADGVAEESMDLPEGATLSDAIAAAAQRHPALQPHLASLLVSRNEEWSTPETALSEGDTIGLMPPVSGG